MAAARLEARGIPTVCGSGQYGPELRGELEGGPFTYYLGNTIDSCSAWTSRSGTASWIGA